MKYINDYIVVTIFLNAFFSSSIGIYLIRQEFIDSALYILLFKFVFNKLDEKLAQ